jgi:hypothetical protein
MLIPLLFKNESLNKIKFTSSTYRTPISLCFDYLGTASTYAHMSARQNYGVFELIVTNNAFLPTFEEILVKVNENF